MQLNFKTHLAIQVSLLAIQILAPAFVPMTREQQGAVSLFVSSVQAVLGLKAYTQTPTQAGPQ